MGNNAVIFQDISAFEWGQLRGAHVSLDMANPSPESCGNTPSDGSGTELRAVYGRALRALILKSHFQLVLGAETRPGKSHPYEK